MLVERITGGYCISEIVGNQMITKRYFGYTKREAINLFREELL